MANPNPNQDAVYDVKSLGTGKTLVLGVQHLFAMFGATVLVPAITGLNVSTTLLFAGLGTLLFHLITGRKVPAFPMIQTDRPELLINYLRSVGRHD